MCKDRVAICLIHFTGASSGIGCACAVELSRWGAKLALTGRNEERLQETADLCKNEGLPENKVGNLLQQKDHTLWLVIKTYLYSIQYITTLVI